MTPQHFEDLWDNAEAFHKTSNATASQILNEVSLKIELYKAVAEHSDNEAKSGLMGEILLSLTHLSLVDNINVFEALLLALQERNIERFDKKYPI